MNWSSWSEFFSMGGYGFYVWGSYAVTLLCIVGEILLISSRRRTLERQYGHIHELNKKETKNETTS
jgi:heme exporter protein D